MTTLSSSAPATVNGLERRARLVDEAHRALLRRVGRRVRRGRLASTRGQSASARIALVAGSMTIAVAPFGLPLRADLREDVLDLALQLRVERELRSLPGTARLVSCRTIGAPSASLTIRRVPSVPRERFERVLQAAQALAVDADAADRLRRQPPARVVAARARDELHARDLELLDLLGLRGRQVAREVDEAALGAELLEHLRLRLAEQRRELRGDLGRVLDEVRGRRDVGRGLGDGELDAVAIGDRAAPRRHVDLVDLLGDRGALQRFAWTPPSHSVRPAATTRRPRKIANSSPMRRSVRPTTASAGSLAAPRRRTAWPRPATTGWAAVAAGSGRGACGPGRAVAAAGPVAARLGGRDRGAAAPVAPTGGACPRGCGCRAGRGLR